MKLDIPLNESQIQSLTRQLMPGGILSWEWRSGPTVGTLRCRGGRAELRANLGKLRSLQKNRRYGGSFSLLWGICYLLEVASLYRTASCRSETYIEGLALCTVREDLAQGGRHRILMPTRPEAHLWGRGRFTAAELLCLYRGAERAWALTRDALTREEDREVKTLMGRLEALCWFPEVEYRGKWPRNAWVPVLERAGQTAAQELRPADPFQTGLALRQMAFLDARQLDALMGSAAIRQAFAAAAEDYREQSVRFLERIDLTNDTLGSDSFAVMAKTLTGLREITARYGLEAASAAAHIPGIN